MMVPAPLSAYKYVVLITSLSDPIIIRYPERTGARKTPFVPIRNAAYRLMKAHDGSNKDLISFDHLCGGMQPYTIPDSELENTERRLDRLEAAYEGQRNNAFADFYLYDWDGVNFVLVRVPTK